MLAASWYGNQEQAMKFEKKRKAIVIMVETETVLKPMHWVCILVVVMLSSAACSAETPSAMSAARQAKLAELTGQLRLGAEYFLNRTDAQAYVEQQFEAKDATGDAGADLPPCFPIGAMRKRPSSAFSATIKLWIQ